MQRFTRCRCRVAVLCGLIAIGGAAGLTGCGGPQQTGFNAPEPGAKLAAIIEAGRKKDRSAIPHLIEQLESDDQAVRMYAILALERITGTRKGYVYYAPPAERRRAVRRWVQAYQKGELDPTRRAEADTADDPAPTDSESSTAPPPRAER